VTTCQACGITTRVPFRPQEGRGVYCPECYQALKALNRASSEEDFS
jgi:CxxC-x17-CxxC domain-containing protein